MDEDKPLQENNPAKQEVASNDILPTENEIATSAINTPDIQNMEVHHHPNVEKKSFKGYLLEGLMIFLAVMLGFFAENIREHITENRIANELAESLYKEVYSDSVIIHNNLDGRLKLKEADVHHFIDYIKDSSLLNVSESFYSITFSGFLKNYRFEPKDGMLSQLRNSGALRYFKSSQLQEVIGELSVAIAEVRTRNATETEFTVSTSRPFLVKHFNFMWFQADIDQYEERTKEEEQFEKKAEPINPEILNPSQFDKQEAINIAASYLMILRGTRRYQYKEYAAINHKLLETLRKEFSLEHD